MLLNKRLQIFISSTYSDLLSERQAAVQAILTCGHIPAGMELFAAGDKSQMQVIKDWILQSDVYLLILGGRYGSIEPESNKSYTQLEYEFAVSIKMPVFAVVISDEYLEKKIKKYGSKSIEKSNPDQLTRFRNNVLKKMVRFFNDEKDIKLAVFETLSEFSRRDDLIGWVPGNQKVDTSKMAEELARLGEENFKLQQELRTISTRVSFKPKFELSSKRKGFTQSAAIGGEKITVTTNEFDDGRLGEIFITLDKGSGLAISLFSEFASSISIGLQHGIPLEYYVDKYSFSRFEPSGMVEGHPNIKNATSIIDFVFRLLGFEYLNRIDLVQIKPNEILRKKIS